MMMLMMVVITNASARLEGATSTQIEPKKVGKMGLDPVGATTTQHGSVPSQLCLGLVPAGATAMQNGKKNTEATKHKNVHRMHALKVPFIRCAVQL